MASRDCIKKCLIVLQNVIEFQILERQDDPKLGVIPGTLDVWVNDLREYSDAQVEVAFNHFRRNIPSAFNRKPRPGDVTQFLERVQTGGWEAGWAEYLAWAEGPLLGTYDRREWSSPAVRAAAIACGGVRALAEADISKHSFIQKQFREAFEAEMEKARIADTLNASGNPEIGQTAEMHQLSAQRREHQARIESERAYLTRCLKGDKADVPAPPPHLDPFAGPRRLADGRPQNYVTAQPIIDKLWELRRRQMGDGPLPPLHKPIVEPGASGFKSLGQTIKQVQAKPVTQQMGELMDGVKAFDEARGAGLAEAAGIELETFHIPEALDEP